MLPDFPLIKAEIKTRLNSWFRNALKGDPLLQIFKEVRHFEGNEFSIHKDGKSVRNTPYTEASSVIPVDRNDVISNGVDAYFGKVIDMLEEISNQKAKMLIDVLDKAAGKTGNIIKGEGPFTPETYFAALEKIDVAFDENGEPIPVSMLVAPQVAREIEEHLPEWLENVEYKKKYDEIIRKKKKEFNDRESDRKLVD